MKKIIIIFILTNLFAKEIFFTRSGTISFYSSALLEDIEAVNHQVTCVLNMENGEVAFRVPIHGFTFENALMQEHFNENYMESDKYPTAGFKGKIENWSELKLSGEPQDVNLTGELTIHGVTNQISETGQISFQNGELFGTSKFNVTVADYDIEIPKIVRENIAKIVEVTVNMEMKKK
jgi:polyisoprenoid-binding protein YceI